MLRTLFFLLLTAPLFGISTSVDIISSTQYQTINNQYVMDDFGNTFAAWTIFNNRRTVLQLAFKAAGGPWILPGNPTVQANVINPINTDVANFQLFVDGAGNPLLVWQSNNRVFATMPRGGVLETTLLSPANRNVVLPPQAAINGGYAVVMWQLVNNNLFDPQSVGNLVVQAAYRTPTGPWEIPGDPINQSNILSPIGFQTVAAPQDLCPPNQAALDTMGNAVVTWQVYNGTSALSGFNVIQAAVRTPTSGWVNPENPTKSSSGNPRISSNVLSPLNQNATFPTAIVSNGFAILLWTLQPGNIIQTASISFP